MVTNSPWRGDFASRSATVAAPAGRVLSSAAAAKAAAVDVACPAWSSGCGDSLEHPAASASATRLRGVPVRATRRKDVGMDALQVLDAEVEGL
jgi:hypothetical protein